MMGVNMKDIINKNEYKNLKSLIDQNKIIYLTYAGSIAYGTNTNESDIDIRGIMKTPIEVLLGNSKFEQIDEEGTDTVVYTINKYLKMLKSCNPSSLEMMGTKEEHKIFVSPIGEDILDNYKMFLSQRAFYTFEGYAISQLNRICNAIASENQDVGVKNQHISERLMNMMHDFNYRYHEISNSDISIYSTDYEKKSDIFIDIRLEKYPLRDLINIFSEVSKTVNDIDKVKQGMEGLNKRNKKSTPEKLNKHAMHLVRLYIMAIELAEKGEVITYREKDKEFLLDIRNGKYRQGNGQFCEEFFQKISEYKNILEYAKKNTVLPIKADERAIEEFVIEINKKAIGLV